MPIQKKSSSRRPASGRRSAPELLFGDLWKFDPAPETTDPCLKDRYELFINGCFVASKRRQYFDSFNPATGEVLARIPEAGKPDVDAAFQSAQSAYDSIWSKMPGKERGKYLYRIARLIQDRSRELAVAETIDSGKPIKESRDFDLPMMAAHFFYYAGWADKLAYAVPGASIRSYGVVGQIIPWNFPLLMLAWKIAPALATGNCVVIKPAETTSITALKFAEILQEAGLPDGVVNIVTGTGATGELIVRHPFAAKIAFTGSTEVGRAIMKTVAGTGKGLSLELGAKTANIVFDDAPIDQAVEGVIKGIFFNQGHICCAGSRLLVQESIVNEVVRKLKMRLATLRVGDPLDKNTDLGAINSAAQLKKITELVEAGVSEGAEMYQSACTLPDRGWFFRPTLFTGVTQSHRIVREEIVGPVLSILTFRTTSEAIDKANNTACGLSAGVWTDKGAKVLQVGAALKAGVIWANTFNKFDPASPFGGYKQSGFGREGGLHGLADYLKIG